MAQARCSDYVGTTVAAKPFEAVVAALGNTEPRGEFETTAQYQARLRPQAEVGRQVILVSRRTREYGWFMYDADKASLRVASSMFGVLSPETGEAYIYGFKNLFQGSGFAMGASLMSSDAEVGTSSVLSDTGVSYPVRHIQRTTSIVVERRIPDPRENLFFEERGTIGQIAIPVEQARMLKPEMQTALVVEPWSPYLVRKNHQVQGPTPRSPAYVNEAVATLLADIQCGLVLDGQSRVLGAYATR